MVLPISPSSLSTTMSVIGLPNKNSIGLWMDTSDSEDDCSSSGSEASGDDSSCSDCSGSDSEWSDDGDDDAMFMDSLPISTLRRISSSPAIAAMSTRGPQLVDGRTLVRQKLMRVDSSPFLQAMDNAPASLVERMKKADCVMGNAKFQLPMTAPAPKTPSVGLKPASMASKPQPPKTISAKVPRRTAAATTARAPLRQAPSPQIKHLRTLQSLGVAEPRPVSAMEVENYFLPLTPAQISAYNMAKASAVRTMDVDALRAMHQRGEILQCANRFGESIVHTACRRGNAEVVRFLTDEAKVSLKVKDDYGRTPMTDACWAPRPNFELIKVLIQHAPDLLLVMDKRGFTPLQYVRSEFYDAWNTFLEENIDLLKPKEL